MKVAQLTFNNGQVASRLASSVAMEADVTLLIGEDVLEDGVTTIDPAITVLPHEKPRLREPLKQIKYVYSLVKQIREIDPDVLHIQIGHLWFNLLGLPFLRKYPIITTVHDPRDHTGDISSRKTPQFVKDYGYKRSDHIIIHSNEMKPLLQDTVGISEDRISVIPLTALGDETLGEGVDEEKNMLLFFGRIFEYKGLEYLIRAEPLIREKIPDVKIVIAGRGEDFDRYRAMMETPESFVVYNEYISNEFQAELFRQASVVVLPYIEATQSGVIPTAFNFGTPVVATEVGGLGEQLDDGVNGYLVEPRNIEELAEKVILLLQNDELREQMGKNGRAKVETEWTPQAIGRRTVQAYQHAIDKARGAKMRSAKQTAQPLKHERVESTSRGA